MENNGCDLLEKSYFCSITNICRCYWFIEDKLWFAWKIVLLQYHKHHNSPSAFLNLRCDLLEKSYFCSITNIRETNVFHLASVVICLKNRTFAVSQTSCFCDKSKALRLWFAWKIVLLQYHKHPYSKAYILRRSCDLLEKSYFCSITNILYLTIMAVPLLWFAWKIVLLQYHKHPEFRKVLAEYRCDLLEKSYFCSITNITRSSTWPRPALWFAWKIVLLQYHKHPSYTSTSPYASCDLLEKSYFCSITNILNPSTPPMLPVVICLKNRTFAVSQTSFIVHVYNPICCDLLEKSYFCSITNIEWRLIGQPSLVVICLKNRTFAVSQTSELHRIPSRLGLWFAWKIVLLQYHKHQVGKR